MESDHARLVLRRTYRTTREKLWRVLTDADAKQRWMGAKRVDYEPGARGTLLGGEFHCEHGRNSVVFRVVSAAAPDQLTTVFRTPLVLVWETARIHDREPGVVELVRAFHWERPAGLGGWLADRLQVVINRLLEQKRMRAIDALVQEAPSETQAGSAAGSG